MRVRVATCVAIVVAVLAGFSSPASAATERVTWSGWRGAVLGANIRDTAAALNKPVFTGCAPIVRMEQLPKGLIIDNDINLGDNIEEITVTTYGFRKPHIPRVRGPLAIHVGMTIHALKKSIKRHGLTLHNRYNAETGKRGDYWVQNSDGHVLWFRLDLYTAGKAGNYIRHKSEVSLFSLTGSTSDAFTAMSYTGGC